VVRAQAFAGAHVQRAFLYDSPQLNAIRYAAHKPMVSTLRRLSAIRCKLALRFVSAALVLVPALMLAQDTRTLRGRVVDDRGNPVPHAEVELRSAARRVLASDAGLFSFLEAPLGETELRVRRLGYAPAVHRFFLGRDTLVTVTLTALPRVLDSVRIQARTGRMQFNLRVMDDAGAPLAGAEVLAAGLSRLLTDSAGRAVIANPRRGTLILRVRKIGHKPFFSSVSIAAERVDTVILSRLPHELAGVAVLAESGFGRDSFVFFDLDSRLKWKGQSAGLISREELDEMGGANLCAAMPQTRSGRLLRIRDTPSCSSQPACILLNGERPVLRTLGSFLASEVETIEYFPRGTDWSNTLFTRAGLTCYPWMRGSPGPGRSPEAWVIWLRTR